MASEYPDELDSFENPSSATPLDSPVTPHAVQHGNANDAIEALQAKVGVGASLASAAPAGAVLTRLVDGSTLWSESVVKVTDEPLHWTDARIGGIVDGAVADQSAAMAAAKALMATAPRGGVLKLPPGEIRLAGQLAVNTHGFRMKGAGRGADWGSTVKAGTTIQFDLDNATDGLVVVNGTPQPYVQDFGLEDIALVAKTQRVSVRDVLSIADGAKVNLKNVILDGGARYCANLDTLLGSLFESVLFNSAGTSPMKAGSAVSSMTTTHFVGCAFRDAYNGAGADVNILGGTFDGCYFESNGNPAGTPANCPGLLIRGGEITLVGPYFENNAAFDIDAGTVDPTYLTIDGFTSRTGGYTLAGPTGGHLRLGALIKSAFLGGGKYDSRNVSIMVNPAAVGVFGAVQWGVNKPTMTDGSDPMAHTGMSLFGVDPASGPYQRFGQYREFARSLSATEYVEFPAGSQVAPGIRVKGDTQTGLWASGAGTFSFVAAGAHLIKLSAAALRLIAGYLDLPASTATSPHLWLRAGVAPTGGSLSDGMVWFDGTNLKIRVAGVTKTVTLT